MSVSYDTASFITSNTLVFNINTIISEKIRKRGRENTLLNEVISMYLFYFFFMARI